MYAEKALIGRTPYQPGNSVSTGFQLNGATLKFDTAFLPTQDITLAKVNFKTTTITGSPTCTVRIETDTAGRPSGVLAWANATLTGVAVTSGWQTEITLTASGSLAKGTVYHLVITNDHATPASNHFTVNDQTLLNPPSGADFWRSMWAVTSSYNGAAWSNRNGAMFMLVSNDGTPVYMGQPVDTSSIQTLSNTTAYGMKFTAPFSCSVQGLVFNHLPNTGTTNVTAKLYDNSDTLLGTATLPTAVYTIEGNTRHGDYMVFDGGPVTLTSGSPYRIVFNDAGSSDRVEYVTAPTSPDYRLVSPIMQDWQWTQGTTGSWTDTTGKVLQGFGLVASAITAAASGPVGQCCM
jgi:hypothetical protein